MRPLSVADYREMVAVSDPALAPDGSVAYVQQSVRSDAAYATVISGRRPDEESPSPWTPESASAREPRWSPSGDRLAYVRSPSGGDGPPQLWVTPSGGEDATQVTDVVGGVSDIAWHPAGDAVAFVQSVTPAEREADQDLERTAGFDTPAADPHVTERLVYRGGGGYRDGRRAGVYVASLPAGTVTRVSGGGGEHAGPEWGDEATLYHFFTPEEYPEQGIERDVVATDVDSGSSTTLTTTTAMDQTLAATEDGRVAFQFTPPENAIMRQREVRILGPDGTTLATPTESIDRTVAIRSDLQWGPDGAFVYFCTHDEGTVRLQRATVDTPPETVVGETSVSGYDIAGDSVLVATQGDVGAPEIRRYPIEATAEPDPVAAPNRALLDRREVPVPEEFRFENRDGVTVQGWVLKPPGFDPDEEWPLAVRVHGGPHVMWTSGSMWHEVQALAANGYLVYWGNYRGSTGYGEAFTAALKRDWPGPSSRDVIDAVDELATFEYVDADSLFLVGESFGAYLVGWLLAHHDRFAAGVGMSGAYDRVGYYGTSSTGFRRVEWQYETTPMDEADLLWEHSPAAHADRVETPLLLLHGEDDALVPSHGSELFYRFLRRSGVEARLVLYPGEGHRLPKYGDPATVIDCIERSIRWLNDHSTHHDGADEPAQPD